MNRTTKIYFREFKSLVDEALKSKLDGIKYREEVGSAARIYRSQYLGELPGDLDQEWAHWLSKAEDSFDAYWQKVKDLKEQKIQDMARGKGDLAHAVAVHYRMHMHPNGDKRRFADQIDGYLFNAPLRERGKHVFQYFNIEETAPFKWPEHVSRDEAFNKDAPDGIWLNPHNHYSIPFSGRDKERELLTAFIEDDRDFLIAAVVAPSGAGKTRLVSEWMKPYMARHNDVGWDAGFVKDRDAAAWKYDTDGPWQPTYNTLIIIDYTYNYSEVIATIINRFKNGSPKKIRLLILDHILPSDLHSDIAWKKAIPDPGDMDAKQNSCFNPFPLVLAPEPDDSALIRQVISYAANLGNKKTYESDDVEVINAAEALMTIGNYKNKELNHEESQRRDSIRHPLFAALVGQALGEDPSERFSGWSRRDLFSRYFDRKQRVPWTNDEYKSDIGPWVGCYICAATLLRGANFKDLREGLPKTTRASLKGKFPDLDSYCNHIVSGDDSHVLKPFEPDILGESFFLKFLHHFDEIDEQDKIDGLAQILSSKAFQDHGKDSAYEFLGTLQRLVLNLINDDQNVKEVKKSWEALHTFLEPRRFKEHTMMRQVVSLASISIEEELRGAHLRGLKDKFRTNAKAEEIAEAVKSVFPLYAIRSIFLMYEWEIEKDFPVSFDTSLLISAAQTYDQLADTQLPSVTLAIKWNFLSSLNVLLESGFSPNSNDSHGCSPLMYAIQNENSSAVKRLLEHEANPNQVDEKYGRTPLDTALELKSDEIVDALATFGSDIGVSNSMRLSGSPLIDAIEARLHKSVETMLRLGADPNFEMANGCTPLIQAIRSCDATMFELLLSYNANPFAGCKKYNLSLLVYASRSGDLDIFERLLTLNLEVDKAERFDAQFPLLAATQVGHEAIVARLLDLGASPNAVLSDEREVFPLLVASMNGYKKIARLLVDAGADVNKVRKCDGASALLLSAMNGHHDLIDLYVKNSVDPSNLDVTRESKNLLTFAANINTVSYKTEDSSNALLIAAVKSKNCAVVESIIELNRKNLSQSDMDDGLRVAIDEHSEEIGLLLFSNGAQFDFEYQWRSIITDGSLPLVEKCLDCGAAPNYRDTFNEFPLFWTAQKGYVTVAEHLLDSGADCNQIYELPIEPQSLWTGSDFDFSSIDCEDDDEDNRRLNALIKSIHVGSMDEGFISSLKDGKATALDVAIFYNNTEMVSLLKNWGGLKYVDLK